MNPGRAGVGPSVLAVSALAMACMVDVQVSQNAAATPGCPFTTRDLLSAINLPVTGDRCLPTALVFVPMGGTPGQPGVVRCILRETSDTVPLAMWCTADHGRTTDGTTCLVDQVPVVSGQPAPNGTHGFYYEPHPMTAGCFGRVVYTAGDAPPMGVTASLACVQVLQGVADGAPACGIAPTGGACTPIRRTGVICTTAGNGSACFHNSEVFLETGSPECQSGACLVYHFAEATAPASRHMHVHCTCRCGVPAALMASIDPSTLCTCPTGFSCVPDVFGIPFDPSVQGSYCVNDAALASVP